MRFLIAFCLLLIALPAMAETTITYQGQLQDGGEPFDGTVAMSFVLHEHDTDDLPVGPTISLNQVAVNDGLFTVELDFGEIFTGQPLWLEASVDSTPLTPRQKITAVPMALNVPAGAGSNWQQVNDDIYFNGGKVGIGTNEPYVPLDIFTDQPIDPETSDTVLGAQIMVTGPGTLFGLNVVADLPLESADNPAYPIFSSSNARQGAAIYGNARGISGPAIGVQGSTASSEGFAGYFIGHIDSRNYFERRVGIGVEDPAAMLQVAGGVVTGNENNQASGLNSFASGGDSQFFNLATRTGSFVGGGRSNLASGYYSFVGGGEDNEASASYSHIAGGNQNLASGASSFVGGGVSNLASGNRSFAAGVRAKAMHDGTFVWSDNTGEEFESTADQQYLVRASGGMGVNTNEPLRGGLHVKQQGGSPSQIGLVLERGGSSTNNWAFYVATSDNLGFRYNDDLVARIDTTGQFATLSDARFKTDIEPIEDPLARLLELEPAQYRIKTGANNREPSLGLIAQQVHDVVPAAVSDAEDTLGIRYNQITALNTAAIIELHAVMQDDRDRMSELQAENETLRQQLAERSVRDEEIRAVVERNKELEQRLLVLEALLTGETRMSNHAERATTP